MWSLLVITSIITQSAVAIFLLNGVRTNDDIHRHLRVMLVILLVHLSTKFLLLAVLKNQFLYTHLPTGFSLAYGPLLLVIARSTLGRPMRPRAILLHFIPFLVFSLVYVFLVIAGAMSAVSRPQIIGYVSWYQWLDLASLYGYPIYSMVLLRGCQTRKANLVRQIAVVLLVGISSGWLIYMIEHRVHPISDFDLRLIPYIFLAATPVLILRYRLQGSVEAAPVAAVVATVAAATVEIAAPEVDVAAPIEAISAMPDRRYEKSGLDAGRMDEYEASLAAFMRKSKIYLDPDLSLDVLASKMKMSKHHLTQLLNERIMKNFYSFINEYRIGEAIDQLNNPALQVNILSLAFDCGFNSRSSFNSYFKKITGHTPSAYRKMQLKNQPDDRKASSRDGKSRLIRDTSPSA